MNIIDDVVVVDYFHEMFWGHSKRTFVAEGGSSTQTNRGRRGQACLCVQSVKKLPNFSNTKKNSF